MGRGRQARVAAAFAVGLLAAARGRGIVRAGVRRPAQSDPAREAFLEERRARMRAARAALTTPGDGGA